MNKHRFKQYFEGDDGLYEVTENDHAFGGYYPAIEVDAYIETLRQRVRKALMAVRHAVERAEAAEAMNSYLCRDDESYEVTLIKRAEAAEVALDIALHGSVPERVNLVMQRKAEEIRELQATIERVRGLMDELSNHWNTNDEMKCAVRIRQVLVDKLQAALSN